MLKVLLLDGSNPNTYDEACKIAETISDIPATSILLSDKLASKSSQHIEIVNIYDVNQRKSLRELQHSYDFSIYKAIATERAWFDYTLMSNDQKYSNLKLNRILELLGPYANALDFLIRERVDIVLDSMADNFKTSLAYKIAEFYKKRIVVSNYYLYWWTSGVIYTDQADQTSSLVRKKYDFYYNNQKKINVEKLTSILSGKRASFIPVDALKFPFKLRLKQIINRQKSYDPLSVRHWFTRTFKSKLQNQLLKLLVTRYKELPNNEKFILFPLHVVPEAHLLGGGNAEFSDQISLIKSISMNLPIGVYLYVKEHPEQQFGYGINLNFYNQLKSLPNTKVLHSGVSAEQVLKHPNCLAVAVINSTLALQAVWNRKPVFLFGNSIFSMAHCFIRPRTYGDLFDQIKEILLGNYKPNEKSILALFQAIDSSIVSADGVDFSDLSTLSEYQAAGNLVIKALIKRSNHFQNIHEIENIS